MVRIVISARAAFPHLMQPNAWGYHAGEYGGTIYFPKTDGETVDKVKEAFQQAIAEKWPGDSPTDVKNPLKDGDTMSSPNRNFEGCYYLDVHSKDRPVVVDRKKQPITGGKEFPNGCVCNFILTFKGYEVGGNSGVTVYLNAVQYIKDGTWTNTDIVAALFNVVNDD